MFFNIFGICVGTLLYLYWLTLCEHVNIMHENHDLAIARSSSSRALYLYVHKESTNTDTVMYQHRYRIC